MLINDKYFKLLNVLIYDKRVRMNGIISSLDVMKLTDGNYLISYKAYMTKRNSDVYIFVEDFEKGNVVFLLPFGVSYMVKEMEELAERHMKKIKEFFGENFREDMVMRISEDDRQNEIRKYEQIMLGLENWDNKCEG